MRSVSTVRVSWALLVGCVAMFVIGLGRVLSLRLEAGDVYPQYSSLRADPMGTKVLFEALPLAGISTARLYRPLREAAHGPDIACFRLGADPLLLEGTIHDAEELEGLAASGARVIVAFSPSLRRPQAPFMARRPQAPSATPPHGKAPPPATPPRGKAPPAPSRPSLGKRWGIELAWPRLDKGIAAARESGTPTADLPGITEDLPLRTAARFNPREGTGWRTLYTRSAGAVVVERRIGRGSLVLCADAYALSNEAMGFERRPAYVAALIGPALRAVFDEASLGVVEQPGVMTLVRRYRLHGVLATLLVIGVLFAWLARRPLLPDRAEGQTVPSTGSRDQGEALVDLLRRSVPERQLLGVCVAEWRKTSGGLPSGDSVTALLDEICAGEPPEATYRRIAHALERARRSRTAMADGGEA